MATAKLLECSTYCTAVKLLAHVDIVYCILLIIIGSIRRQSYVTESLKPFEINM